MVSRARRHRAQKENSPEATDKPTAEEILRRAERTLAQAEDGLTALRSIPRNSRTPDASGVRDIAVYGHATTMVLKNLKSVYGDAFVEWWQPRRDAMAADPLMKFFYRLRSEILKEGGPALYAFVIKRQTATMTDDFDVAIDTEWEIRFEGTPTEHKGSPISDLSIENVAGLYVDALRLIVRDAREQFANAGFDGPQSV